jgi:hypothetical protein
MVPLLLNGNHFLVRIFKGENIKTVLDENENTTCCICMSLSEGRDTLGEVAEDDHGGVLLSPSEEGTARAGVTAIGLECESGMNEESRTRPALSGEFS